MAAPPAMAKVAVANEPSRRSSAATWSVPSDMASNDPRNPLRLVPTSTGIPVATATWAMACGVAMVRAHDVAATVAAAQIVAGHTIEDAA